MTPPGAPQAEFAPVFDWSPPRTRKFSLLSFIAASAALHALCFYLFQIIYPPTVALLPPPARVHLITADSEDGRLLLRWIESEDPALSSTTQRPPDAAPVALPVANHVPSYADWSPVLRELPPMQRDLSIPSAQPPGPVPLPSRASQPAAASITPSTLRFGRELDAATATTPPLQFTASRGESPEAVEFRIALDANGVVRHCFLQRGSGDAALDEQARRAILLARFPSNEKGKPKHENQLLWTTATIEWGNDIASPPAPALPNAAP